ncbi:hypothetical protein [Lacticaseibacillus sp. GG6-2]
MTKISLTLAAKDRVLKEASADNSTYLAFTERYASGDTYVVAVDHTPCYIVAQLDAALAPALIYLTESPWRFTIPVNTQREWPYPDAAFAGDRHYATVRYATTADYSGRFNLAVNSHDLRGQTGAFPHASANAETRGELVFFARNAIDGLVANEKHGNYPFQSWGIDQRDDATFSLDFGRPVVMDTLALVLRADYPHDSYWTQLTVSFSDGTTEVLKPHKTAAKQRFTIKPRTVTSLQLTQLVKDQDASTFPALTEIEAYGHNA